MHYFLLQTKKSKTFPEKSNNSQMSQTIKIEFENNATKSKPSCKQTNPYIATIN